MFQIWIALLMASAMPFSAAAAPIEIDAGRFGVVNDGVTLNTLAIQKLIDSTSAGGGGMIRFSAGRYLTGTIEIKDGVRLHLDENAVIVGSTNDSDYRNLEPFLSGDGGHFGEALIVAIGATNAAIEGSGTIDGQGRTLARGAKKTDMRPFLTRWVRCKNVTMRDVHLLHPRAWTNVFSQCDGVTIENLNIRSRTRGLPNTDGIDIDSTRNVSIKNCDIETGDDAICIKATSPESSGNITISRCTLSTTTSALKLGTESLGDFDHIDVSNCHIVQAGYGGISLYSVDGANLHDLHFSDLVMENVGGAVNLRLGARLKTFRPGETAKPVGTLRDITIRNVRATGVRQIGILINGIPNHPVENLTMANIDLEMAGGKTAADAVVQLGEKESAYPELNMFGTKMPAWGMYVRHARAIHFDHITLRTAQPDGRPQTVEVDVTETQPPDFWKEHGGA